METQLNSYFLHNKEAEWITTHLIQKQELMNSKTPVNHALFFKCLQNNPSSARYSITNFALLPPEDEYGDPFQDLQKSWEIDYQNNYVGFTEYGTQIPLEEALKILDRTMEHHEPDITRELGKNDVISCGLDNTVFVNGKTRPHINRLIDFKERYPEHLQKIIEEGYDFRRDGCSIAPAWFSQRNYIGPKKEFLDKELTAWRHMEYLKPYDKIIREKFGPPVVISALHVADDGKMRLVDDLRYTNLMDHTGHVYLFICFWLHFYSGGSMLSTQPPGSMGYPAFILNSTIIGRFALSLWMFLYFTSWRGPSSFIESHRNHLSFLLISAWK